MPRGKTPIHSPLKPLATRKTSEQNSHHWLQLFPQSPGSAYLPYVCPVLQQGRFLPEQYKLHQKCTQETGALLSYHGSQPQCSYLDGLMPTEGYLNMLHGASRSARITLSSARKSAAAKREWLNWSSVSKGLRTTSS